MPNMIPARRVSPEDERGQIHAIAHGNDVRRNIMIHKSTPEEKLWDKIQDDGPVVNNNRMRSWDATNQWLGANPTARRGKADDMFGLQCLGDHLDRRIGNSGIGTQQCPIQIRHNILAMIVVPLAGHHGTPPPRTWM